MTIVHASTEPAQAAAEALAQAIAGTLEAPREAGALDAEVFARVALPGGSALKVWPRAAELLGDALRRVRLTWVDERCVALADAASNRGATHRATDARPAEELALWLDGECAEQAVPRVRSGLRAWGGALDISLLGMGPDGHIASLFPGRPWRGDLVRHIDDSPKPPAHRMTLTRALLGTAEISILLASGEAKRPALLRLLAGDPALPAAGLPDLRIFTDLDLEAESTP